MLLFLRVHTVDVLTERVVVIGSCLVDVFRSIRRKVGLQASGCVVGDTLRACLCVSLFYVWLEWFNLLCCLVVCTNEKKDMFTESMQTTRLFWC